MSQIVVCALYKFVTFTEFEAYRQPLLNEMLRLNIKGTLLIAAEGINGTIAGSRESIDQILRYLNQNDCISGVVTKESYTNEAPFHRTKVKLKKEIVTMGIEGIDPLKVVGTYVKPKDWNDLISDPDVVLVDTRNDYEYQVGTFKDAINPNTESFRQFPEFVDANLDKNKHKKVAMFCTGGIRCEKSTAFMKEKGFEDVYHLEGGILKYLEEVPEDDSLWQGECFVFDERVTVNHQLEKGDYHQCHACRLPITESDMQDERYEVGVSCPSCFDKISEKAKHRFAEREKQMQLAKQRGESHLGSAVSETIANRREAKKRFKEEQKQHS